MKGARKAQKCQASNASLTQSQAQQQCIEWINKNPDKCLHLYGMLTMGLCNPPDANADPQKMNDIPHSKTTLAQVSSKHIQAVIVDWHPSVSSWLEIYGHQLAHDLLYFGAGCTPTVPVHLHGFDQFKTFYTTRYKALGSNFTQLTVPDAETIKKMPKNERIFPWNVGWFTLAGDKDGKYTDVDFNNGQLKAKLPDGVPVDDSWQIVLSFNWDGAQLQSKNGIAKITIKDIFMEEVKEFKDFDAYLKFGPLSAETQEQGRQVGLDFTKADALQTPDKGKRATLVPSPPVAAGGASSAGAGASLEQPVKKPRRAV